MKAHDGDPPGVPTCTPSMKSEIGGGLFFIRNASLLGPHLILNNTVEANVLVISTDGGVAVTANTIGNNLICQNNTPPAVDAGNVVGGQDNCTR